MYTSIFLCSSSNNSNIFLFGFEHLQKQPSKKEFLFSFSWAIYFLFLYFLLALKYQVHIPSIQWHLSLSLSGLRIDKQNYLPFRNQTEPKSLLPQTKSSAIHYSSDRKHRGINAVQMTKNSDLLTSGMFNSISASSLRDETTGNFRRNTMAMSMLPEKNSLWSLSQWLLA